MSRGSFSAFLVFFFVMILTDEISRLYRARLATESCGQPPTTWMTSTGEFTMIYFKKSTISTIEHREVLFTQGSNSSGNNLDLTTSKSMSDQNFNEFK